MRNSMKNRILSILLILCMLLSVLPMMGITASAAEGHTHGTELPVTGGILSGNYYLNGDVTLNENITVEEGAELNLCLNGHVLTGSGNGSVITVKGTLNLYDCNSEQANMITANDTDIEIKGGAITGGIASNGGGIYVSSMGSLNVNCGNIVGNTANNGGGIYVDDFATAIINDCMIWGNTATENGGGIWSGGFAEVLLKGCRIKGNKAKKGGGIYKFGGIQNSNEENVDKCVLLNTKVYDNTAAETGGGVYFRKMVYKSCFAPGTFIAMADGSNKKIEDVVVGDIVKTFDHENGIVSTARVYLAYKGDTQSVPFKLSFDGKESISFVGCHDLLEKNSRKYITLTEENAGEYIGSSFYGEDGQWHELLSVTKETVPCDYYSIYTAKHQNVFANGLLAVPDDVDYLLNIYDLDETLKADEAQLEKDIALYGLATYEYSHENYGMSREWFENASTKYLFIAIGKGLVTLEYLENLYGTTVDAAAQSTVVSLMEEMPTMAMPMMMTAPLKTMTLSAAEEMQTLDDFDAGVITVGNGTQIVNNKANSQTDNLYLAAETEGEKSLITLYGDTRKDILVGVTTETSPETGTPVQITTNGAETDRQYFFHDGAEYAVLYDNSSNYLELSDGYKVMETACENGSVSVGYNKVYCEDDTVTITATPEEGYVVDEFAAYKTGDTETRVTVNNDGTFSMPAHDVTVSATFKSAHVHAWTYKDHEADTNVAENTITATCGNTDCSVNDTKLTISAPALTTYGETNKSEKATLSGTAVGGLSVSENDIKYQKNVNDVWIDQINAPIDAGTYKAVITVTDNSTDYTAYVVYTIAQKQLTITGTIVDNKEYDGSTAATAKMGNLSGIISTDKGKVTASIQSAVFADKNVGTDKTVTVKYALSGTAAANYKAPADDSSFTATISPKQLSISEEKGKRTIVSDKIYDGNMTAGATVGTAVGIISGDNVAITIDTATFTDKNAGTDKTVDVVYKLTGSDADNYSKPSDGSTKASILPKSIKVRADNKSSYIGSNLETLTYSADDLCNGDNFSGSLATNANKDVVGNAYTITIGDLTAGDNYSMTFTAGTYTVKALESQTLSFADGNQTRTYGDASFTKKVSGASTSVTYESSDSTVATVDGSTGEVTILKTGTTVIKAKAKATAIYSAAEAGYTLTVNNASQNPPDTVGKVDESIRDKTDGIITGVTTAMEYRKATDSTYTAITGTEVTGLAAGEYRIRYAAKTNYDASPDKTLTISEGGTMTLTFDADGGSNVSQITGIKWHNTVTVPETTRTGYTFQEWNTEENGTGSKLTATTKIEANDTYYAIWQANSYTITFLPNNGVGYMEPQSFTYDIEKCLTANGFTRSGYNFIGWGKTADALYAEYLDGASVKNLSVETNGNVNLYALWSNAKSIYSIRNDGIENGKLTVSRKNSASGKKITITVKPDEGYMLEKLTVADANDNSIPLTEVNETTYIFRMPASDVTVLAVFSKNGKCPQDETCVYEKFTDCDPEAWYRPGVHFCVENGYMVGISVDKFDPSASLSRAMIVAMLWRMEDSPIVNFAMSFTDVAEGTWYTEAIRWAQSNGIVGGYDKESFGPDDNVTREQLSAILMHYAAFKGIDVSKRADITKFTDVKSISDWALENVKWANAVGMILGRTETTIDPTGNATRAEAANMLQRFCENILK